MRLPRVRITVGRLMMAVAVVALTIFIGLTCQRRSRYLAVAEEFARREKSSRAILASYPGSRAVYRQTDNVTGEETGFFATQNADYYTRMREKYERAARQPWTVVGPDPFEPE